MKFIDDRDQYLNDIYKFCLDALSTVINNDNNNGHLFVSVNYFGENNSNVILIKPTQYNILKDINIEQRVKDKLIKASKQNTIRKINDIYYYKNLTANAYSLDHLSFNIEGFHYSKEGFHWKNVPSDLIKYLSQPNKPQKKGDDFFFHWNSLEEILSWNEQTEQHLYYHNDFDFFFLPSGTKSLKFLPIPILSSISIWLVYIENEYQNINFNKVYQEARYLILNQLINELKKRFYRKLSDRITDPFSSSRMFVYSYIESLSQLLLPMAYRICEISSSKCYNQDSTNQYNFDCFDMDKCDNNCIFESETDAQQCFLANKDNCSDCQYIHINSTKCSNHTGRGEIKYVFGKHLPCIYKAPVNNPPHIFKEYIVLPVSENELYNVILYLPSYNVDDDDSDNEILIQNHPGYRASVKLFKQLVKNNFLFLLNHWQHQKDITNANILAAVSQIIARSFAHNIGAHVALNATNEEIQKRIETLYPGVINQINDLKTYKRLMNWINEMTKRFDIYEINRAEYIADPWQQVKTMRFYHDIVLPFVENTIIMDNLTASENINYRSNNLNKLKIHTYYEYINHKNGDDLVTKVEYKAKYHNLKEWNKDSNVITYPENFPYLLTAKEDSVNYSNAIKQKQVYIDGDDTIIPSEIKIAIRNEHSFYSILENYIRNAAKHNMGRRTNSQDKLEISLLVSNIIPTENCNEKNSQQNHKADNNYYYLYIYDNHSRISKKDLKDKIIKPKNDSLLDENGSPKKKNFGISDMKINALLMSSYEDISDESLKNAVDIVVFPCKESSKDLTSKDFIKVEESNFEYVLDNMQDKDGKYSFGYRIKLAKKKYILWIGKNNININTKTIFEKYGIDFLENINDITSNSRTFSSYDFAIIENINDNDEIGEDILKNIPFRLLWNGQQENKTIENLIKTRRIIKFKEKLQITDREENLKEMTNEILKQCWEVWLSRWGINEENKYVEYLFLESKQAAKNWENFQNNIIETNILDNFQNNSIELPESQKYIVLDRHGKGLSKLQQGASTKFLSKENCYLLFTNKSKDYLPIVFSGSDFEKTIKQYEIAEMGLMNILVADERWVKLANNKKHKDVKIERYENNLINKYWEQALGANIFLINKIKMNEEDIPIYQNGGNDNLTIEFSTRDSINSTMKVTVSEEPIDRKFDMLIIHRTFITKMLANINDINELLSLIRKHIPFVILVSGGGYPHNLEKGNFKFAPLSLLQENISDEVPKLNLVSQFMKI